MTLNKHLIALPLMAGALMLGACHESADEYTPYDNWAARNAAWFDQISDSARTAIREAKAQYGDQWEEHCTWRQYKSLLKAQDAGTGSPYDSICVRVIARGEGTLSPVWSDSVRLNMRGWLMPATYRLYNAQNQLVDSVRQQVFTQSYYGAYDRATAAPTLMAVASTIEGFSTALQYMTEGDDWMVYIPQQLGYGAEANSAIPAYSTLQFRLSLTNVYPSGSGVPAWKAARR